MHNRLLDLFKKYLLVGGLPDAVNAYIETKNITKIRAIQEEIHQYYAADAAKYDQEKKLVIRKIYDMIPSNLENKKKRIIFKNIENKNKGYADCTV
jgi:predicted AAA+ superfamily ATPase